MNVEFAKGDRVQLSPLGIHELIVRRPKQRTMKTSTVGVIGSPSYCGGCVRVRFEGKPYFEDFAAVYLRAADA